MVLSKGINRSTTISGIEPLIIHMGHLTEFTGPRDLPRGGLRNAFFSNARWGTYLHRILNDAHDLILAGQENAMVGEIDPAEDDRPPYVGGGTAKDILGVRYLWQVPYVYAGLVECAGSLSNTHVLGWTCPYEIRDFNDALESKSSILTFCNFYGAITAIVDKSRSVIYIPYFHGSFLNRAVPVGNPAVASITHDIQTALSRLIDLLPVPKPEKVKSTEKQFPLDLFMGLDVEFSVIDSDKVFHSAYEYVPDNLQSEIGTDGNVETLEIRPEKAKTPEELTSNVKDVLFALSETLPDGVDIWGGGGRDMRRSTGLHIHFSGISTDAPQRYSTKVVDPVELARWLDVLLAKPIFDFAGGTARSEPGYGRYSDVRNKLNHHGFPHDGFEYRTLPTVCYNEVITRAILAISYMIAVQFEMEGSYTFDEKAPLEDWYKGLPMFEKYKDEISKFIEFLRARQTFAVPLLANWFGKKFQKMTEGDINIVFDPNTANLAPFRMYNPQRICNNILFTLRKDEGKQILSNRKIKEGVNSWLIGEYGIRVVYKDGYRDADLIEAFGSKLNSMSIGLPIQFARMLNEKSVGSRQYLKMFAQQLINKL